MELLTSYSFLFKVVRELKVRHENNHFRLVSKFSAHGYFMANGLRGVKKKFVRKTQQLYSALIFAQLLIKQKLKELKLK